MIALLQSACRLWLWKNFENRPVFDEVMPRILYTLFLDMVYVYRWHNAQYKPPTRLKCRVESRRRCVTQFATNWRQSRRVWTNLPTAKSSCVMPALWTHPSTVVTQFTISCALERQDCRHNDVIGEKLSISIKIHVVKPLCSVTSVSKLSTESVGSRRELVANCVHTADADATQLDSCVASASAVCIGLKTVIVPVVYMHHLWMSLMFSEE